MASHVITTAEFPRGELMETKGNKLTLVKSQYPRFKRKKSRVVSRTSMKAFKNNPENRRNHINSFQLGLGETDLDIQDVVVNEKTVYLNVKKSRKVLHVDGITFVPTIGGIVISMYI
jgi:hypothetical protein